AAMAPWSSSRTASRCSASPSMRAGSSPPSSRTSRPGATTSSSRRSRSSTTASSASPDARGARAMESRREREFQFELPIGWLDADGVLHRTAALRKMTGRDEALMADKANRGNGARLITELLASCLVRLGTIARPEREIVQQLYSADRHFLLV